MTQQPSQPMPMIEPLYLPQLKLTRRELQVVQLVSQDMNDQQIANRLCLHIGTG
jgi:DNA-binding CsgD family transcriptional regulator